VANTKRAAAVKCRPRRKHVWLTLAIGAVGFGGCSRVYTYLGLDDSRGDRMLSPALVPVALCVFVPGSPRQHHRAAFADRALMGGRGLFSCGRRRRWR